MDGLAVTNSGDVAAMRAFLKDPVVKAEFRTQVASFLERNPGLLGKTSPIVAEYVQALLLHFAKPLIVAANTIEQVVAEDDKKKCNGNSYLLSNIGLRLVNNVSDHLEAIEDVRIATHNSRAYNVGHEDYAKYFRKGAPQTNDMIAARNAIKTDEAEIGKLRSAREKAETPTERGDIATEMTVRCRRLADNKKLIRNEEEKYLAALKKGTQAEYEQQLRAEGKLPEVVTYRTIMSAYMPESGVADAKFREIVDAHKGIRKDIAAEEKKIREQRQLLKKAKTDQNKDECFEKIDASIQKIAELKKVIVDERSQECRTVG